jgi:hypothetical protein
MEKVSFGRSVGNTRLTIAVERMSLSGFPAQADEGVGRRPGGLPHKTT